MNEISWDAILKSLDRSADTLRKIATRPEVPKAEKRDLRSFAAKIDASSKDCRKGKVLLGRAVLLRSCARLKVESARLALRKRRLGLGAPDSGMRWTSAGLNDIAAHIRTGRKLKLRPSRVANW